MNMGAVEENRTRITEVPLQSLLGSAHDTLPIMRKNSAKKEVSARQTDKDRLTHILSVLEDLDKKNEPMSIEQKMEILTELEFTLDSIRREMPDEVIIDEDPVLEVLERTWCKIGYYVTKDEYGIKMVLPPVMMERTKKKGTEKEKTAEREYAMNSIKRFLLAEKSKNNIEDTFLMNQVLIFTHERIKEGLFDIDNLSTSYYINAISDVFLAGDSAKNLDIMQRYIRGEENRTVCYLVKRESYIKWVKDRY